MGRLQITAELVPKGPAAAVILDDEQVATVGEGAKRFPVAATVNGHTFRTTVTRMRGEFMVGFSRAVREAAGVQPGETITLELALDTEPREVEVPPALAAALDADPEVKARYEAMAFTHRKEYARWIAEAKRDETRDRRVAQALDMIRAGQTRS